MTDSTPVLGVKGWLQACAIATVAALSAVATHQPAAAAVMIVVGLVALPLDVGDGRRGRGGSHGNTASGDPELLRLEMAVRQCREGDFQGSMAIDRYIALAEWRVRHRAPRAETRVLLQEALAVAAAKGDWVGEVRLEDMLRSLDRGGRPAPA